MPRLGVFAGDRARLSADLLARLAVVKGLAVRELGSCDDVIRGVERGELEAGLIVPGNYQTSMQAGRSVVLQFLTRPGQQS